MPIRYDDPARVNDEAGTDDRGERRADVGPRWEAERNDAGPNECVAGGE
jgi:hypothetical protein